MRTLERMRKVRPDLVEFDGKSKWHLSFDTVSNEWRDPMEQPRTFCGKPVAWYMSKRPGWDGDEAHMGRPVCKGCLMAWKPLVPR